jgi:hypothetical protein
MRFIFTFLLLFSLHFAEAQCSYQILNCPVGLDTLCDESHNTPLFWNHALLWDELHQQHDLAERSTELTFEYIDSCGASNFTYELLLDLNNDGVQETILRPDILLSEGRMLANNVNGNPGDTIEYDHRPVPPGSKYGFALEQLVQGDTILSVLRWNTANNPDDFVEAQLPLGNHLIYWIITNGTNTDTCSYPVLIRDCKQPTVVCESGLSLNLLPNGTASVDAFDVLIYTEDNNCPTSLIQTAIKRTDGNSEFPLDSMGNPVSSVSFSCDDLGTVPVQLWAMDASGNAGFCETNVIILDNQSVCDTSQFHYCVLTACSNDGIEDVSIKIYTGNTPWFPPFGNPPEYTGSNGCVDNFDLGALPFGSNATIAPLKDDNHQNGVSTYDLVLISKHILGIEVLDSPYKIIAADMNNSRSVTTFDIVEGRKLILGIYDEFPNTNSWRFVHSDFSFSNPINPFLDTFPEFVFITDFQQMPLNPEFLGLKVGDVNCTAIANSQIQHPDDRQSLSLYSPNIQMKSNTLYEVPVFAEGSLLGLQAALQIDPALGELVEVLPGSYPGMSAEVFAQRGGEEVRLSWFHHEPVVLSEKAPLFTLRIRAKSDASLDQVLQINPSNLRAEAYTDREEQFDLQLLFREEAQNGMEFFAPYPNPGSGAAFFPVATQDGGPCILSVYDTRGQLVFSQKSSLAPGMNQLEIPAEVFVGSGVFIWKMECGGANYSGKLIR